MPFNMRPTKNPMPSQEPNVRNKNFKEVAIGYTEEMAIDEAKRCLNCKNKPCVAHCPVNINIPSISPQILVTDAPIPQVQSVIRSCAIPLPVYPR